MSYRDMLLDMVDEGLDHRVVLIACLKYMSEQEVKDMMELNGFIDEEDE